jgi:hypothetical protein
VREQAKKMNLECLCTAVARDKLSQALDQRLDRAGFGQMVLESRPHLFSSTPFFVTKTDAETMAEMVRAIERVACLPDWSGRAMAQAPEAARVDFKTRSVFMGYDFHIGVEGPRLIEINTNAGGAYLNAVLLDVIDACCEDAKQANASHAVAADVEAAFIAMFQSEMQAQMPGRDLGFVAIVDNDPSNQYLLPEFELAQALFQKAGIDAVVADPSELVWQDGRLLHQGRPLDLVYNRLVDFGLDEERHAALRSAYLAGAVVVTPSSYAHALLADKRHLTLLSDADSLLSLGAAISDAKMIAAHVPRTVLVGSDNAEQLWAARKRWFFKPGSGHAGKAAYRGDKMTKGVWEDILKGGPYVAQEVAPPSERGVMVDGAAQRMKSDIRLYTYDGQVQLMAARLYQGQTTNFRTQGGGFAPVLVV